MPAMDPQLMSVPQPHVPGLPQPPNIPDQASGNQQFLIQPVQAPATLSVSTPSLGNTYVHTYSMAAAPLMSAPVTPAHVSYSPSVMAQADMLAHNADTYNTGCSVNPINLVDPQ